MTDLTKLPEHDYEWDEDNWFQMLQFLKDNGLATYKEMASSVLSALNPPQVGTAVANAVKGDYPPRQCMQHVYRWFYERPGYCVDCGTRLELQADHVIPKETFKNPKDADHLDNLELRCRRCNVIKRPSHTNGGVTFLTTAAALMWILFTKRPNNYNQYEKLCREYGLTMANVRFREAWALAVWLNREGKYDIKE